VNGERAGQATRVVALDISRVSFDEALERIYSAASTGTSGRVCFANVHMTIEAEQDPSFAAIVNESMLVLPDGLPVALAASWLSGERQPRISGMDSFPLLLSGAAERSLKVFLLGGSQETLDAVSQAAFTKAPGIQIVGTFSPPFREPTEAESRVLDQQIIASGAQLVFVSLGCPKQERWMAAHQPHLPYQVLLGVGGAFPVYAGLQQRAPKWAQGLALEWFFRLMQEPDRLWRRYLFTNSRFVWLLLGALLRRIFGR
jgi:N-acetylglucosaminyldiphosphoundecaprenol N-acetyl-beta-D-mannosaminyltransferase